MSDFVAQLDITDLEALTRGDFIMNSPLGILGNAGVYGGNTENLRNMGVIPLTATDGPSGIRLRYICSLMPCGMNLASTWDTGLIRKLMTLHGEELAMRGSNVLLAPGMNIIRDPLCGRNFEYKDDDKCAMWTWVHDRGLPSKLRSLGKNIAIQGEFCAPGIQKNRLRLMEPELFVFDVFNLDTMQYAIPTNMQEISEKLELKLADIEETGDSFIYTIDELLDRARGKYLSGVHKEGIVIRSQQPTEERGTRISFKAINNDFLLKEDD